MKKVYKGIILNQQCIVRSEGIDYWLLYDNTKDDYIFVKSRDKEGSLESIRVANKNGTALYLSQFDDNLFSEAFGQISEVRQYRSGYNCLCSLQNKSKREHTTIKVDPVKKTITRVDIEKAFGKNIEIVL
jgi:hypothetical protein